MNSNNILQKLQNITKYLSIASLGIGVFNTISNQTTIQSLRDNLDQERRRSFDLTSQVNNIVNKENLNQNIEINNSKLEVLTNKVNKIIENNLYENTSLSEINNSMKEINNELVEIINKIDDSLNNEFIGLEIFNHLQSYYIKLNYFQSFALAHLSGFMFISLSLISLISLYFGDYLIERFNIEDRYPRIFKFVKLRRKFQRFYLILDLSIIFIILILLSILNIMLFANFTF